MRFHQVYMKIRDTALTDEQMRDYIDETERLDEAQRSRLAGLLAEQVPGFSMVQDEQERLARRSATDRLLGVFTGMARRMEQHQQAAEKAGKWWPHGCRYGGQYFFHYAGTPEAEEENRRIEKILETEDPAEERKLLFELLRPYKTLTGDQVEAMTDQQIIDMAPELEQFLTLYSLEMPQIDSASLTEEQRQEFRELQAKKDVFDMLGGRMEMIANPNYEFFQPESLLHINHQAIEEKYPRTQNDRENRLGGAASSFLEPIARYQKGCAPYQREKYQEKLRELGYDTQHGYFFDGNGKKTAAPGEELRQGKRIVAVGKDGMAAILSGASAAGGYALTEVKAARYVDPGHAAGLRDVYQRLDDANPLLLFTGSQQYKDLLDVAKKLRDAPALLGEPTTLEQVVNMTGQLTRLLNASQSYLRYKDKPIEAAKNDTERRRMEAAKAAEEYAQQKLKQLQLAGRTRELQMLRLEQCVLKEPQGEVDQSALNRASLQYITKNVRKWTGALSAFNDDGNSIESLSCMAYGTLGEMCQQPKLLDGDGEVARNLIANMLTADLIWKERETSQTHPLEQALEKDPQEVVDSLMQDPLFDKLLGDLTPRKLYDFLVNDRVSEMGDRFMAKSRLTVPGLHRHGGEQAPVISGAHQSDRGSRVSDAPSQRSRSQSIKL